MFKRFFRKPVDVDFLLDDGPLDFEAGQRVFRCDLGSYIRDLRQVHDGVGTERYVELRPNREQWPAAFHRWARNHPVDDGDEFFRLSGLYDGYRANMIAASKARRETGKGSDDGGAA